MCHGDDQGLVLPPRVAPLQAVIIPVVTKKVHMIVQFFFCLVRFPSFFFCWRFFFSALKLSGVLGIFMSISTSYTISMYIHVSCASRPRLGTGELGDDQRLLRSYCEEP